MQLVTEILRFFFCSKFFDIITKTNDIRKFFVPLSVVFLSAFVTVPDCAGRYFCAAFHTLTLYHNSAKLRPTSVLLQAWGDIAAVSIGSLLYFIYFAVRLDEPEYHA